MPALLTTRTEAHCTRHSRNMMWCGPYLRRTMPSTLFSTNCLGGAFCIRTNSPWYMSAAMSFPLPRIESNAAPDHRQFAFRRGVFSDGNISCRDGRAGLVGPNSAAARLLSLDRARSRRRDSAGAIPGDAAYVRPSHDDIRQRSPHAYRNRSMDDRSRRGPAQRSILLYLP